MWLGSAWYILTISSLDLRKANTDPAPRKGIFLKPTSRTENTTSNSSEAAHTHQSNTNSNFVHIGLNIWPKCTPMMDDTFLVEVRFRLPVISTKLAGVHVGAEGGWTKIYTWPAPSSPGGAQMGASRTTDLLEFYSEFGPRIGLEKMARAGVDISSDSVSVITSALTIRNIAPSSGHFF